MLAIAKIKNIFINYFKIVFYYITFLILSLTEFFLSFLSIDVLSIIDFNFNTSYCIKSSYLLLSFIKSYSHLFIFKSSFYIKLEEFKNSLYIFLPDSLSIFYLFSLINFANI